MSTTIQICPISVTSLYFALFFNSFPLIYFHIDKCIDYRRTRRKLARTVRHSKKTFHLHLHMTFDITEC